MAKDKQPPKDATPPEIIIVLVKNRADNNGGHVHLIMDDIDDKHVSLGLSTQQKQSKKSRHNNYPLEIDPLDTGKKSYLRKQGTVRPKTSYHNPRDGKITAKDYVKAKEYAEKTKRKYIDGKNNDDGDKKK